MGGQCVCMCVCVHVMTVVLVDLECLWPLEFCLHSSCYRCNSSNCVMTLTTPAMVCLYIIDVVVVYLLLLSLLLLLLFVAIIIVAMMMMMIKCRFICRHRLLVWCLLWDSSG